MAGRARSHAIADALDQRTRDYFEHDPLEPNSDTQLDYVTCWVAEGKTVKALAQELTDSLHFEVWAETLLRYLRREYGQQETDDALDAARVRASHSMAEEALELVDAPADTMVDVSRASSRARSRQWLAERYNPQRFGQSKGVNVSISVGSLHLQALQHVSNTVTSSPLERIAASSDAQALPSQVTEQQALSK